MAEERTHAFVVCQKRIRESISALGLPPDTYKILTQPHLFAQIMIPVAMDDGTVEAFTGYAWQHVKGAGSCGCGLRFSPDVREERAKALSMLLALRHACVGLPCSGVSGAIRVDAGRLSRGEIKRLSGGWSRETGQSNGIAKDAPALGSGARRARFARGCAIAIREAAKKSGVDLTQATCAVQGHSLGSMLVAQLVAGFGARVVAVSDARGGAYCSDGLDARALSSHKETTGSVVGFAGSKDIAGDELLGLDLDVLVLTAFENQITRRNADGIRARIVVEAANGSITPEADTILDQRGILVVPDILACAGGLYLTEDAAEAKLERDVVEAFESIYATKEDRHVSMRTAAYMLAIQRIYEAMK